MAKTCTKTFIKRGQEIKKENLKPNGIYAVRYTLPAEIAALYGTVQEQWGLVQLDAECNIVRTWNVDVFNAMESTNNHQPWFENLTFFRSSQMERQFLEFCNLWIEGHIKYTQRLDDVEKRFQDYQYLTMKKLSHPMHRFADWVIRVFLTRKVKK